LKITFLVQFPLHPFFEKPFNIEKKHTPNPPHPTSPHSTQTNFRKGSSKGNLHTPHPTHKKNPTHPNPQTPQTKKNIPPTPSPLPHSTKKKQFLGRKKRENPTQTSPPLNFPLYPYPTPPNFRKEKTYI
jgi:hypothetical protein